MGNFEAIFQAPVQQSLCDLQEIHLHIILTGIKQHLSAEQLAMCLLCLTPTFAVALTVPRVQKERNRVWLQTQE